MLTNQVSVVQRSSRDTGLLFDHHRIYTCLNCVFADIVIKLAIIRLRWWLSTDFSPSQPFVSCRRPTDTNPVRRYSRAALWCRATVRRHRHRPRPTGSSRPRTSLRPRPGSRWPRPKPTTTSSGSWSRPASPGPAKTPSGRLCKCRRTRWQSIATKCPWVYDDALVQQSAVTFPLGRGSNYRVLRCIRWGSPKGIENNKSGCFVFLPLHTCVSKGGSKYDW